MKKLLLCLLALIVVAPAWGSSAVLASWAGVIVELKGSNQDISALAAKLEKAPVYKAAACAPANIAGDAAKIDCAKADSGLMTFLGKNAPATVQWSISSAAVENKCLPGCTTMRCPPPGGPVMCCYMSNYTPC